MIPRKIKQSESLFGKKCLTKTRTPKIEKHPPVYFAGLVSLDPNWALA